MSCRLSRWPTGCSPQNNPSFLKPESCRCLQLTHKDVHGRFQKMGIALCTCISRIHIIGDWQKRPSNVRTPETRLMRCLENTLPFCSMLCFWPNPHTCHILLQQVTMICRALVLCYSESPKLRHVHGGLSVRNRIHLAAMLHSSLT